MKFIDVFSDSKLVKIPDKNVVGIDIGSRQAKAVLLSNGEVYTSILPTGFFMQQIGDELLESLLNQAGLSKSDIQYIVSTGYGRIALDFGEVRHETVTEISCHGLGAAYLGDNIHTIIDIGGQDSKTIRIDPDSGKVLDFAMNDKCAAGTGRFLEKAANLLEQDVTEIGEISLKSKEPLDISSQCVVFSESEIISGRARGDNVEDIAAGIHLSVAKRVNGLLHRVGIEPNVLFTGGVSNNVGMVAALNKILGFEIQIPKIDTVYAGAIGAALFAAQYAQAGKTPLKETRKEFVLDLSRLEKAVNRRKRDYEQRNTGKAKNVAYLCSYTPQEILSAANVAHIRLLHAGSQKEVMSGEAITGSVFCDFTKSVIGGFEEKNPLSAGVDKVYNFYTCDCMRKTTEAIDVNYTPAQIFNLPRKSYSSEARRYFAEELESFKEDLEKLTGSEIKEDDIRKYIALYNQAKKYLREISDYRKADIPLFGSSEYQIIAQSYYYLPVEELLVELDYILKQLEEATKNYKKEENVKRPIRLMLAGGIVAEGDKKLIEIIEKQIGAVIVIEDNCTGYSPFAKSIEQTHDSVYEDVAEGYLTQAPCARMQPLDNRIEHSLKLAKEYHVDGIIYSFLKFCPCYSFAKNEFIKKYQELDIPFIDMPVDYAKGDEGQIKTRLDAFIEVLSERGIDNERKIG